MTTRMESAMQSPTPLLPSPFSPLPVVVTAGGQAQTATREADAWPLPQPFVPPWYRPPAAPPKQVLTVARICDRCDVWWYGAPPCFACGRDGRLRFWGLLWPGGKP